MAINSLSGSQASNSELKKITTQTTNQSNLNRQPEIRKETSNLEKIQEEINQSLQINQPKVSSLNDDSPPQRLEENQGITSRAAMANAMAAENNNKEIQTEKTQSIEKKQDVAGKSSTAEKVEQAVASVNDYIQNLRNRILEFTVDGGSGRMVVRVIDTDTRKTIRQIPPEEMLHIAENLGKDKGWLLEQKV